MDIRRSPRQKRLRVDACGTVLVRDVARSRYLAWCIIYHCVRAGAQGYALEPLPSPTLTTANNRIFRGRWGGAGEGQNEAPKKQFLDHGSRACGNYLGACGNYLWRDHGGPSPA